MANKGVGVVYLTCPYCIRCSFDKLVCKKKGEIIPNCLDCEFYDVEVKSC